MTTRWPGVDGEGRVLVKVCGICTVRDARACVAAGVDAIGLNFWPGSSRKIDAEEASRIVRAVGDRVAVVGLFVDAEVDEVIRVRDRVGFDWIQLHGDEPPRDLGLLGPRAYKALRVRDATVRARAARYGGPLLLLDAWVRGRKGGTGERFDWGLAEELAAERPIVLAGGLDAANVADAVRQVRPRAVDVASGVERAPGDKDEAKVEAFVAAVRDAV